jgi:hypothetical protein
MGMNPVNVYLDSCIVIYYVERHPVFFTPIRDRLIPISNEKAPTVVLSNLTRMECRVHPRRSGHDELLARFDEFFASSDLDWVLTNYALSRISRRLTHCIWQRLFITAARNFGLTIFA